VLTTLPVESNPTVEVTVAVVSSAEDKVVVDLGSADEEAVEGTFFGSDEEFVEDMTADFLANADTTRVRINETENFGSR
jgi:hypothetical protein